MLSVNNFQTSYILLKKSFPKVFPAQKGGFFSVHISAYITLKNLAVRRIMEAMRTAYTKIGLNTSQTTHETNDLQYFFSLVRCSEFVYVNLSFH